MACGSIRIALYIDGITSLLKTFFEILDETPSTRPGSFATSKLWISGKDIGSLVSLTMDIVLQPSFQQRISSEKISLTACGSTRLLRSSMH